MTAIPGYINALESGGFMKKCSGCGRLKATFVADPRGHRGIGSVCKQCDQTPKAPQLRKRITPEAPETPAVVRGTGRPNKGSVWLRNGVWQVTVTVDGSTRRMSSRSGDRAVAEALRNRLLGRVQ